MKAFCLVESLADRERVPQGVIVDAWLTTSPRVVEVLEQDGARVINLEAGVTTDFMNDLGEACHRTARTACRELNRTAPWRETADTVKVFGQAMSRFMFALFYKGHLLAEARNLAEEAGRELICVGDVFITQPSGLIPQFERFDRVFAHLAKRLADIGTASIRSVPGVETATLAVALERRVKHRRIVGLEKFLSLLNTPLSAFMCKAWRRLAGSGGVLGAVRLRPRVRRDFYFAKDCELVWDLFLPLLLRGGRIRLLPELPGPLPDGPGDDLSTSSFASVLERAMAALSCGDPAMDIVCRAVVEERVGLVLARFQAQYGRLVQSFERVLEPLVKRRAMIVGNAFASPSQVLFSEVCKARRVDVAAVEHGTTLGVSRWSEENKEYSLMRNGNVGIFHNEISRDMLERDAGYQRQFIFGFPKVMKRTPLLKLQRSLLRKSLGIQRGKRVVMAVANLDHNNFVSGPYLGNDIQSTKSMTSVVRCLCKTFPEYTVVLKLYPSFRYLDEYSYKALENECPNLIFVRDFEFRYLRLVADAIFVPSNQSTLGWALTAPCTTYYLDNDFSPIMLNGLRLGFDVQDGGPGHVMVLDDTFMRPSTDDISLLFANGIEGQ